VEVSRTLTTSPGIAKCETPKSESRRQFRIPGVEVSKHFTTGENREMRNAEIPKAGDSFGYRDFGYRELGMSRTLTTGVPESRNVKRRNPEIGTPTKNVADREITPFRGPGYRELKCRNTSSQECRNVESPKCENAEIPEIGTPTKSFADREITPFRSPGYRELKCRNTSPQKCRNAESPKCETMKYWIFDPTPFQNFGYRELEELSTETLHHRSPEMVKHELPKCR
jgi:hypothetical protein